MLLGGGLPGVLITVGGTAELPLDCLSPEMLRFEAEMSRVRAESMTREAAIELSRAVECDTMRALREKQLKWQDEHPDWVPDEDDVAYLAYVDEEYAAAEAAREHSYELTVELRTFLEGEQQRLRDEFTNKEPAPADA
jgi:hypothetical protein